MKRFRAVLTAMVMALFLMGTAAPAALASDDWCDTDPLVVIKTPAGNLVPVFNTVGAKGLQHQPAILLARVSYTTQRGGDGRSTVVNLNVTVPDDLIGSGFPTRAKISTGPMGTLKVLATATGTSGKAMPMQFTLDVP
jgi:hypothetical protein